MMEFNEALGVDVGTKRIGIARVGAVARLPQPVTTLAMSEESAQAVTKLAKDNNADVVVVGLPRNLSSEDTNQTTFSRQFADTLIGLGLNVVLQDEALSSVKAEEQIKSGVYKNNAFNQPVTVDEVAACIILNDFIGA